MAGRKLSHGEGKLEMHRGITMLLVALVVHLLVAHGDYGIKSAYAEGQRTGVKSRTGPPKGKALWPPPAEFQKLLKTLQWVDYAPTHFDPTSGIFPKISVIKQDLALLRQHGFNGIVTYGSDKVLGQIPKIAKSLGYRGVIMGIWLSTADGALTLTAQEELKNAVIACREAGDIVIGYVVGNEGLGSRYTKDLLVKVMDDLRKKTNRRVTTAEQIENYFRDRSLITLGDWIFPIAHPYWHRQFQPKQAVDWLVRQVNDLKAMPEAKGRFVMLRETGFPTGREAGLPTFAWERDVELNEDLQAEYFEALRRSTVTFVYFEAFDQPWKNWQSVEPFWGLFDRDRRPKKAALQLLKSRKGSPKEK
jgi:exo-beta-1,3-glucanase (GH17 family)